VEAASPAADGLAAGALGLAAPGPHATMPLSVTAAQIAATTCASRGLSRRVRQLR